MNRLKVIESNIVPNLGLRNGTRYFDDIRLKVDGVNRVVNNKEV